MPDTLPTFALQTAAFGQLADPDFSELPEDSSDLPEDSTLMVPNLSLVPLNMFIIDWRCALASSPKTVNSTRLR